MPREIYQRGLRDLPRNLPTNWEEGRPERHAFSFDSDETRIRGNAVSAEGTAQQGTLHISVADASVVIPNGPDLETITEKMPARYDYRKLKTLLSLDPNTPSPTITISANIGNDMNEVPTFTQDRVAVRSLKFHTLAGIIEDNSHSRHEEVNRIYTMAQALGEISLKNTGVGPRSESRLKIGHLISQQSANYINRLACQYFQQNNIPALYYVPMPKRIDSLYTADPAHDASGADVVLGRVTSPLHRLPDLINTINLAAHLNERQLPYDRTDLRLVAHVLNTNESRR